MKNLLFALFVALVSLSSCEFFPGDGPSGPPDETAELTTKFWASSTEYGQEQDVFKKSDDIYLNYTLKNETGKPVTYFQHDGGPFVGYTIAGAGIASNFYMVHPEATPTVIVEGILQPGEEIRYSWKATEETQFPADFYMAHAEVRRNFDGIFTVPSSVNFTVAD